MKFANVISAEMEKRGMTKQRLSDLSGVPYMTVSGILNNGASSARLQNVLALCEALDINPSVFSEMSKEQATPCDWGEPILTAYEKAVVPTQEAACAVLGIEHVKPHTEPERKMISKIVYNDKAAAGDPMYAESEYERIDFYEDEVPLGADFGVRISGKSMEPTIEDGCIVWVHQQEDIMHGQIGVFNVESGALCKRYYKKGGTIKLTSDNPAHGDIEGEALEGLRCVGKVLQ